MKETVRYKATLSKKNLHDLEILAREISLLLDKHVSVSTLIDSMIEECLSCIKET